MIPCTECSTVRSLLGEVEKDNRVMPLTKKPGLKSTLNNLLDQLKLCQKALSEFLEVQFSIVCACVRM